MITCPKCSKDNQDHYKFCLGCGAELPRDAAPKPFAPQTPPQGVRTASAPRGGAGVAPARPAPEPQAPRLAGPPLPPSPQVYPPAPSPLGSPSPLGGEAAVQMPGGGAAAPAPAALSCPQCGHINAKNNLFCGSCGYRLGSLPDPARAAPAAIEPGSVVLTALRADGSEAGAHPLSPGVHTVGREMGGVFGGDSYLSPRHATFKFQGGQLFVKDEGSLNGVYRRLTRDVPIELKADDIFRIGQEIIKVDTLPSLSPAPDGVERLGSPSKGYVGRIALVVGREETGNAFPIPESGIHLGRERGDVLFLEDGYVSGLHCRISYDGGRLLLTDLGSSNGTFVRLREETELRSGDVLLMGQQLFRVAIP